MTANGALRAVVVGVGGIGRRHLDILRALETGMVAAALRHEPDSPAVEGVDVTVRTFEDAVAFQPDIAILAGPAPGHVPMAIAFARQGAHLFIEKPVSDRLDGVAELMAVCRERQRVAAVGYVLRFHPAYRALKVAVAGGRIGRVLSLRAEVGQYLPDWRPNRDYRSTVSAQERLGGGAILELSHEIDCVRWLAGDIRSVSAMATRISGLQIDVEDVADILLEFNSGAIGTVHMDMVRRPGARRVSVIGETGVLELEAGTGRVILTPGDGGPAEVLVEGPPEHNRMYIDQLSHFLDCVRTGHRPEVGVGDGLAVLKAALAAKHSAVTGARVRL